VVGRGGSPSIATWKRDLGRSRIRSGAICPPNLVFPLQLPDLLITLAASRRAQDHERGPQPWRRTRGPQRDDWDFFPGAHRPFARQVARLKKTSLGEKETIFEDEGHLSRNTRKYGWPGNWREKMRNAWYVTVILPASTNENVNDQPIVFGF